MTEFGHFAVIDWSGAAGARQKGIAIAICATGEAAPTLVRPGHVWSRQDAMDWILSEMPDDTIVGLDLSPGLPFVDHGSYFPGWPESPADARALWALVERICSAEPHLAANHFVDHPEASRYFRRHGRRVGDRFGEGGGRLRFVEHRQRDCYLSPYSCLNLVGAAQVGKSSLTAMRMLHRIGNCIPIWPFDPRPRAGPMIVEIYTSLAARAGGLRKGLSKIRDAHGLDSALEKFDSRPHHALASYSDHMTDAILTAAWLRMAVRDAVLWSPKGMNAVAATEGWTFGVP